MGAVLVMVAILSAHGQQLSSGRGRPIQFSQPGSDVVSSNVNEIGANQTKLNSLNDDFKKPFELFGHADDSISSGSVAIHLLIKGLRLLMASPEGPRPRAVSSHLTLMVER